MSADEPWFYLDPKNNERKGPMPTSVLQKLLEKGLLGLDASTQVWKTGMDGWKRVDEVSTFISTLRLLSMINLVFSSQVPVLHQVVAFQAKQWYYLDINQQQHGPVFSRLLLHKMREGELDGLSMVYGGDTPTGWQKISDVPELREAMQKIAEEEEALEQARLNEAQRLQDTSSIAQMTFVPGEDDLQPALPALQSNTSAPTTSTTAPKFFEDDEGNRYKWDEEEQDWVLAEDDDEDLQRALDEAAGVYHSHQEEKRHGKDKQHQLVGKKRGRKPEDAEEGGDDNESVASEHSSVNEATAPAEANNGNNIAKKKRKNKKKKSKAPTTWVYVDGLPEDITSEELQAHFSKVGLIALNPLDQQPRIKIYLDPVTKKCKGDCSICYNAEESVQLAVDIFDGGFIRPNCRITVTRASFDHHNSSTATDNNDDTGKGGALKQQGASSSSGSRSRPSAGGSGVSQAQFKVARSAMKAALAWNEDDDSGIARSSALRIVVLEGMFVPSDFLIAGFDAELEEDIASECSKFGDIEKLTVFSKNPRGIAVVKFATAFAAQECIRTMNGRFFGGRQLKSFYWDGATNYSISSATTSAEAEDAEEKEEEKRLEEFGSWLEAEQEELPEEFRLRTE